MPRGNFNVYFASRGGPHVRAEEAAGIALLIVILAALLILGCWYFRRRSGYKMIRSPRLESPSRFSGGQFGEGGATTENKMGLAELRPVLPNAPPAYEKISIGSLPPPYSP
ncbi:melanoma antigen recognized by T-cells 1 isoform X2 [Esox lucius]|uniref:Melan-A n=1 Tax=Esox lucius TaxID=8010 RepID=A0AAY5L5J3_ESOLU|nr:melanoma antigen recognized by T-cells 1 isoform X2 [Esox lucius]